MASAGNAVLRWHWLVVLLLVSLSVMSGSPPDDGVEIVGRLLVGFVFGYALLLLGATAFYAADRGWVRLRAGIGDSDYFG